MPTEIELARDFLDEVGLDSLDLALFSGRWHYRLGGSGAWFHAVSARQAREFDEKLLSAVIRYLETRPGVKESERRKLGSVTTARAVGRAVKALAGSY